MIRPLTLEVITTQGVDCPMQAKANPILAFFLSLLVPGWGLLYAGRLRWAAITAALLYGGWILAGLLGLIASPPGIYALIGYLVLIKLSSAVLAAWCTRQSDSQPIPGWRVQLPYVAILLLATLSLGYPLRSSVLGYALYKIPAGSMASTIAAGDYIIVDTRPGAPRVGDIVAYLDQGTGIQRISRVAGVAGDELAIVNGEVLNNGRSLGLFHSTPGQITREWSLTLAPVRVEPGHVYLLGDNRDNSNDSRFIGQVAQENITARVTGIWYSTTPDRAGTVFDETEG